MNLVYEYFDFTFGITNFTSLLYFFTSLGICCTISSLLINASIVTLYKVNESTNKMILVAFILGLSSSLAFLSFMTASEISTDQYEALYEDLKHYSHNIHLREALKQAALDNKITDGEKARLYQIIADDQHLIEVNEQKQLDAEIKNKVLNIFKKNP